MFRSQQLAEFLRRADVPQTQIDAARQAHEGETLGDARDVLCRTRTLNKLTDDVATALGNAVFDCKHMPSDFTAVCSELAEVCPRVNRIVERLREMQDEYESEVIAGALDRIERAATRGLEELNAAALRYSAERRALYGAGRAVAQEQGHHALRLAALGLTDEEIAALFVVSGIASAPDIESARRRIGAQRSRRQGGVIPDTQAVSLSVDEAYGRAAATHVDAILEASSNLRRLFDQQRGTLEACGYPEQAAVGEIVKALTYARMERTPPSPSQVAAFLVLIGVVEARDFEDVADRIAELVRS